MSTSTKRTLGLYGLVAVGGFLQTLAFAGFSIWPLAFICFVPLLFAIDQVRHSGLTPAKQRKHVVFLGLLHGVVAYTGGYYWMYGTIANFSGFPVLVSFGVALIFWLFHGCQQAVIAWLVWRMKKANAPIWLAFPAALCALEYLFPTLFPSFLATGFHNVVEFIQVADLGGPILLSAVAAVVNALIYEIVFVKSKRGMRVAMALGLIAVTYGYGAYRVGVTDSRVARADKLKVGAVQVAMGMFEKHLSPNEGLKRHLDLSKALEDSHHPELIIWPESAYTYFLPRNIKNIKRRVTGQLKTPLLFGGLSSKRIDGEVKHFNTAFLANGSGDVLGKYDKTYLLAFGEYIPLGEQLPVLYELSPNTGHFTPGESAEPMLLDNVKITTLICYEDVLPGFTRKTVRNANPDFIANVTNDAWFGDTHEPWIHLALAKFRSVEHHRAMVRVTNSGVSAFVDPSGRTTQTLQFGEMDFLFEEIALLRGHTVYQYLGDWPAWIGMGLVFWFGFIGRTKRTA